MFFYSYLKYQTHLPISNLFLEISSSIFDEIGKTTK